YNRISPRSMVQLLAFAARQPWFEAWLADQPIGGIDGSLERRFVGTPLEGKVFAKTGTLNGANALSGMMIAESGRALLFSIIANDRPAATRSAIAEMDAALNVIAAAY
ncbi:MAG: D-alanyl-D-alanine carboxypeptidase, partial [Pseudomonadota bacterium]